MESLRDYQETLVGEVVKAHRAGARRILVVAPTGAGKTRMVSVAVARLKLRCASFAHRREIVGQIADAMERAKARSPQAVGVTSARASRLAASDLVDAMFFDEAHHIAAPSYMRLLALGRGKFVIGATATPYRADGARIAHLFDKVLVTPSARELANCGYLAQVDYFTASNVDFAGVKKNLKHDFDAAESLERVRIAVQAGDLEQAWAAHAGKRPALIYCINQQHCELVQQELAAAGIPVGVVTARTKLQDRHDIVAAFEAGALRAIINCEVFTEGTDIRGVHTIILLRPTLSRGLYKQMIGRGLRPDVPCIVIDHVGNHERHGDVLNEDPLEVMDLQGTMQSASDKAGLALPVNVGRGAIHIERVAATFSKIWVPSVFRQVGVAA